jgi:hypothetical protein
LNGLGWLFERLYVSIPSVDCSIPVIMNEKLILLPFTQLFPSHCCLNSSTIEYQIPELSFVTLKIYDILGNEIAALVNEEKQPGYYEVEFDSVNLVSGIYFYRIQAGSFIETKKMVLRKKHSFGLLLFITVYLNCLEVILRL